MGYTLIPAADVVPGDVAIITGRPATVIRVDTDAVTPGLPDRTVHIYAADDPSDPVLMRPTDAIAITQLAPR